MLNIVWAFIFFYSIYSLGEYTILFISVSTLLFFMYVYYTSGAWPSIWCWLANTYMLWLVFRILIVLPFYEYSGVC
jgi:hypothetical protein